MKEIRVRPTTKEEQSALIARCQPLLNPGIGNTIRALDIRVHIAVLALNDVHYQEQKFLWNESFPNSPYVAPTGGRIPTAVPSPISNPDLVISACDAILDDYGIAIGYHYTLEGRIEHLIACLNGARDRMKQRR